MNRGLAVHGMRRRWVRQTLEHGLTRDSAAWFLVPSDTRRDQLETTMAAAVYHAISRATRDQLALTLRPGGYAAFFATAGDHLPALLFFPDEPTGREEWDRYLWPGPPAPGPTHPYTKVARAHRCVELNPSTAKVIEVTFPMLERAEASVDAVGPRGPAPRRLYKLPAARPVAPSNKLTSVCAQLGRELVSACPIDNALLEG